MPALNAAKFRQPKVWGEFQYEVDEDFFRCDICDEPLSVVQGSMLKCLSCVDDPPRT